MLDRARRVRAVDGEQGEEQAQDAAAARDLLSVTGPCLTAAPKQGRGIHVVQVFVEIPPSSQS